MTSANPTTSGHRGEERPRWELYSRCIHCGLRPLRENLALMQKLKAQFDPDRILNPGRFVGGL